MAVPHSNCLQLLLLWNGFPFTTDVSTYFFEQVEGLHQDGSFPCGGSTVRVWKGIVEELHTIFLEPENGHFSVGCIYGRNNDNAR